VKVHQQVSTGPQGSAGGPQMQLWDLFLSQPTGPGGSARAEQRDVGDRCAAGDLAPRCALARAGLGRSVHSVNGDAA
jgi:hypothetical protein